MMTISSSISWKRVVTAAGYEVVTARNGDAALLSMQQEFAPNRHCRYRPAAKWMGSRCAVTIRRQSYSGLRIRDAALVKGCGGRHSHGPGRRLRNDYVSKRTPTTQLVGRLRTAQRILALEHSLKRALADRERMAMTDVLTGAHNRRYLLQHLSHELDCAQRSRGRAVGAGV